MHGGFKVLYRDMTVSEGYMKRGVKHGKFTVRDAKGKKDEYEYN